MAKEQITLLAFEQLSPKERLHKLADLSRRFENANEENPPSAEEKNEYATALVAVQHAMVDINQKKPLKEEQKIQFAAIISKTIEDLSEHNIRLPIPEKMSALEVKSLSGFIEHLNQAKKVIDTVKKKQKEILQEEKDSVVSIILSFQHFLCKVYRKKESLNEAQERSIASAVDALAILIPELAAIGIKIPVPEIKTQTTQKQQVADLEHATTIEPTHRTETEQAEVPEQRDYAAELTALGEQISSTVGNVVQAGVKRFRDQQEAKRQKRLQEQQQKARARAEKQAEQARLQAEAQEQEEFQGFLASLFPTMQMHFTGEIKMEGLTVLPGDILQVKDNLNGVIYGHIQRGSSRSVLMQMSHSFLAHHRKKIGKIERGRAPRVTHIIGENYNIGLAESTQTYISDMGISAAAACDKGIGYSDRNEDRVVTKAHEGFFAVVDGMGGAAGGDLAASILAEQLVQHSNIYTAAQEAHKDMRTEMERQNLTHESGAAFVTAQIYRDERNIELEYSYSGDCTLIVLHANGGISVAEGDSLVGKLVEGGSLTKDEVLYHPRRNVIINSVSPDKAPSVRTRKMRVNKGDRVILASDGISDNLTPQEIRHLIQGTRPEEAIRILDRVTSERMKNYQKLSIDKDRRPEESKAIEASRQKNGVFADGYRSAAKRDNRSVVVFDIY